MARPSRVVIALDSNVVIDLMRGLQAVRDNHFNATASGATFVLSALVAEELNFAVEQHPHTARERPLFDAIIQGMAVVPFERSDAEACGRMRAAMEVAGRRAPYSDFLIGAHAVARDLTLVTSNTRHFQNIPGVSLLDWRQPPGPEQDLLHA